MTKSPSDCGCIYGKYNCGELIFGDQVLLYRTDSYCNWPGPCAMLYWVTVILFSVQSVIYTIGLRMREGYYMIFWHLLSKAFITLLISAVSVCVCVFVPLALCKGSVLPAIHTSMADFVFQLPSL